MGLGSTSGVRELFWGCRCRFRNVLVYAKIEGGSRLFLESGSGLGIPTLGLSVGWSSERLSLGVFVGRILQLGF